MENDDVVYIPSARSDIPLDRGAGTVSASPGWSQHRSSSWRLVVMSCHAKQEFRVWQGLGGNGTDLFSGWARKRYPSAKLEIFKLQRTSCGYHGGFLGRIDLHLRNRLKGKGTGNPETRKSGNPESAWIFPIYRKRKTAQHAHRIAIDTWDVVTR